MAELWRVMKQSRRSSLSSRCPQLSTSTSITQAEGRARRGGSGSGPVSSRGRYPTHSHFPSTFHIWLSETTARCVTPSWDSRPVALISIKLSGFYSSEPPLFTCPVNSTPWQQPTNQLSSWRGESDCVKHTLPLLMSTTFHVSSAAYLLCFLFASVVM